MDWKLLLSNARVSREELKRVSLDDHISFLKSFTEHWDGDIPLFSHRVKWEINRLRTLEARRSAKILQRTTQNTTHPSTARRL